MHLGILSSPFCKFELKEVIPAFLDTGEGWSLTSGCGWLVVWAEKYMTVGKEGRRLWYLLPREKQQPLSQAVCRSRRCCQLNITSLQGHQVLLSQARPARALPGHALCWLQHALTKGTLFLLRKSQHIPLSTFPFTHHTASCFHIRLLSVHFFAGSLIRQHLPVPSQSNTYPYISDPPTTSWAEGKGPSLVWETVVFRRRSSLLRKGSRKLR